MIEELAPGVVVVGTAHISPTSVAEVERTILERRPAKVLVELDPRRLAALQDPEAWRKTDIVQVVKDGKQHLFLLQLYLAAMQARMGRDTGVAPGTELLRAVQAAKEVGAEVVLMDRDIGTTLKRAFAGLGFQQRAGLFLNVLLEALPAAPEQPRKDTWMPLLVPAALIVLLAGVARLRERLLSGTDRILDLLVGFPTVPALTLVLLGAILGGAIAFVRPNPREQRRPWSARVTDATWTAVLLGLVAAWAHPFMTGTPALLERMLPGPTGDGGGAFAAALWGALGFVLAHKASWGLRRVLAQRRTFQGPIDVEGMLNQDAITQMTDEFARFAPSIKHTLIDERDAYMASHIAEHAQAAPRSGPRDGAGAEASVGWQSGDPPRPGAPGGGIVAVVGAGHMPGIRARFAAARPQDRLALDDLPRPRLTVGKVLGWAIPLALVGVFVYLGWRGYQDGNFGDLLASLGWFALITATCSALGAAVALGHPLSIAAAFVAAPIATLHPLIASGWFAGIVEAKVRTPKVEDFEAIKTLETFGQFWRNGVVRILLVTAITNLGAMVGFWIATTKVVQILQGGA